MEFDANPTIQEILDELNKTAEGKAQLELAALRAVVAKQQAFIVQSNGTEHCCLGPGAGLLCRKGSPTPGGTLSAQYG